MDSEKNKDASLETNRLLSELDQAIDRSSVMRDIIGRYERLRSIENITGPSRLTRIMRTEIRCMENQLDGVRAGSGLKASPVNSPG